ncbi:hypothetical protein BSNK01_08460 [Bacillaceae bacterium]
MKLSSKMYILALLFVSCVLLRHTYAPAEAQDPLPFNDLAGSYAKREIIDLYHKQIASGVGNGMFAPEKSITRAEFTAMLLRVLHLEPVRNAVPAFSDTSPTSWYYGAVHAAVNLGIVSGTGPATFEPDKPIARQEAAVILVRALKQKVKDIPSIALPYTDSRSVSSWAVPSVDAAHRLGIMRGFSGAFRPLDPISRQEAAVVFARILNNAGWSKQFATKPVSQIQLGWIYNQTVEQFKRNSEASIVNTISPRWFFLTGPDRIMDHADPSLVAWARQSNKKVWAMVGNRFDRQATHQFLTQKALRDFLIRQLADGVKKYQLDGLSIDFENLDPADRNAYSSFIADLAKELHKVGAVLSVCVPPDLGTDWSEPYDYAALGKSADYIVLMGYDEHWSGAPKAGSVSSLPWLQTGVEKLVSVVPAHKVILGLPLYTRDWSKKQGKTVSEDLTLRQQNALIHSLNPALRWDEAAGQYVATYKKAGVQHQIWVEDSRSLSRKYRVGASREVAGFAYWYIGSESPDVWTSLKNEMKYIGYEFSSP